MRVSRTDKLRKLFLDQLPPDGSNIGNGQLLQRLRAQAGVLGGREISDNEFNAVRESLLAQGWIVKGKGRGGSTARAVNAAHRADSFTLSPSEVPASQRHSARQRKTASPKLRKTSVASTTLQSSQVISYRHGDTRKNNPEVGLVSADSDPVQPKKVWAYNPHLDPVLNFDSSRAELDNQVADALASGDPVIMKIALEEIQRRGAPYLQWAGKAERVSFEVDTVSLHVHERIDPMSILATVGVKNETPKQASIFAAPFENMPLRDAVDFYRHDKGWANRLVSGDSLQVMNSLLVKEGMAGQVQMVYIDPPYGIKYGSNFQPFVGKRDVKDKNDADLTQEPEMIKAFRDTWELGVHSYLTYLRDRLLLAQSLLDDTGSVFVQISEENVHYVRQILSEVFGAENFVADIIFVKAGALGSSGLPRRNDYIIWYAKSASALKYKQLFVEKSPEEDLGAYRLVQEASGKIRPARTGDDLIKVRALRSVLMTKPGPGQKYEFEHLGRPISCGARWWGFPPDNMTRLQKAGRVAASGSDSIRYLDDFAASYISNVWLDTATGSGMGKIYVVQTNEKVVERCLLMTSDPGDLVLDITCGSGTTATVAEKWGRRWITCDTSRVAVTLAKQRLMTASFDYFELAYPHEGLKGGFIYKTVPHITLKSIANNADIDSIYERLHPAIEEALAALNAAFAKHAPLDPLTVAEGVRKGQKLKLGTKGVALHEWEVPYPGDDGALPSGWPPALREPFDAFHAARQRMQAEMDRSIAANGENETLYDQPEKSKTKLRITGPFTVEAVPYPTVLSLEAAEGGASATPTEDQAYQTNIARSGESSRQQQWRDELLKTGIRGKGGQKLEFAELEVMPGTICLHATGVLIDTGERAVVSFGPEHGALEQRQVETALNEAGELFPRPKMIVFCAFTFDPEAAKDIDALKGITALKAQMNTDLLTEDLKKARSSNQSFWLMGQPDVALTQTTDGLWQVEVNGFDYFDTVKGELISGGKGKIAMWSLDTDYDGRSLFPRQVFFPMAGKDEGWKKLKKTIRAELDESLLDQFHGTVSLPFEAGKHAKAAVKIVDDRGIESLKILPLVGVTK